MIFINVVIKKFIVFFLFGCIKELRLFDFSIFKLFVERNKYEFLKFFLLKCIFCMLFEVFGIKVV